MNKKLFLLFLFTVYQVVAKQPKVDPKQRYVMPAGIHNLLKGYSGEFRVEYFQWNSPELPPTTYMAKSTHKMILGGRFLQIKQVGMAMGVAQESVTTIGFNNYTKKFEVTSLNNSATGSLVLKGSWNQKKRTANLLGVLHHPKNKQKITVRHYINFIDSNTLVIKCYNKIADAPETKTAQYKFYRVMHE